MARVKQTWLPAKERVPSDHTNLDQPYSFTRFNEGLNGEI